MRSSRDPVTASAGGSVRSTRSVVAAVGRAVAAADGDLVVVSHGGVGSLLLCHLLGVPVDRRHDQPGQGSWFRFDRGTRHVPPRLTPPR